ncbi:JAB domain-containing protein [bacterium]|nr:JAB domain-containing protein [bacterium]
MNKNNFIKSSSDAHRHLRGLLLSNVEEVWAIALGPNKRILGTGRIFKGTVNYCIFHPRDIFRFAILKNSSGLIIAHNHPSQDSRPSTSDIKITQKILKLSEMMEIELVDHIIITSFGYFSFADHKMLKLN